MESSVKSSLVYRPDIDGLRAVAVLLVLFDHIHLWFLGGYIGVDVFFVISGYLISSIILSEMSAGKFSILAFYERRIRRIFPALMVMLAITALLAYRYLVPSETVLFAKSMIAATFSFSNFVFWRQSGYFDLPSSYRPLLHTWSLAVEEQFYIMFPIFLILVKRLFPKRLRTSIWVLAIASFVLACVWVRLDESAAFYIAPLRAWELLIGTILSQKYFPAITGKLQRNVATLTGFLLIMAPAVLYSSRTPFPGLAALPPCLGAALIIAGGETGSSWVGALLSTRPMVFVGLISYSLYLWHWPVNVFQNTNSVLLTGHAGGRSVKLAIFVTSFVLAVLSWRFVELPFRKGPMRLPRQRLFALTGVVVALITAVGIQMIASKGDPGRFNQEALAVARYTDFDSTDAYRVNTCLLQTRTPFSMFRPEICLKDDPSRPQYLLLGDSHAAALYYGLATTFRAINFSQATVAACKPFLQAPDDLRGTACAEMAKFVYGDYLIHHPVAAVVITARWEDEDIPELEQLIGWLHDRSIKVILVGPVMEYDSSLPRLLTISIRDRDSSEIQPHYMHQVEDVDRRFASLARDKWKVRYISFFDDVCHSSSGETQSGARSSRSGCPIYAAPRIPMLSDGDHLTPEGSALFAEAMKSRNQLP